MGPVIGMGVGGIIDRLLKLYCLFDLLGDIRVHGADHDGGKAVPVHVDVGNAELCGQLNLCSAVSGSVASVGDHEPDVGERTVDQQPGEHFLVSAVIGGCCLIINCSQRDDPCRIFAVAALTVFLSAI